MSASKPRSSQPLRIVPVPCWYDNTQIDHSRVFQGRIGADTMPNGRPTGTTGPRPESIDTTGFARARGRVLVEDRRRVSHRTCPYPAFQ